MESRPYKEIKKQHWLPYVAALVGFVFSIIAWYFFPFWPTLVIGILFSCILGLIFHLAHLSTVTQQLLDRINADFNKEMEDRIHVEETKQKLEKALLQGQKLQAIGTLAGGIAHDFNNLLYAIIGYVDMSRDDVEKDSLVYNNLGKVLEAARRGQELIARILAFSRRQHHEFKTLCLEETIEGVLELLKPTIPASVTIDYSVAAPKKYYVLGNETQLHQVMVNMINNAVDAMDGEGTVTIRLSHVAANDKLLEQYPETSNKNYCKIEITDTGHGMDQATIERIFEPFFTTKEVGKGTGLGLSTVHAIVEEHEAEIAVESQLGHGTTFTILLPEYNDKEIENGKNSFS